MAGQHFLIVSDEPDDGMELEDPADCPTATIYDDHGLMHTCPAGHLEQEPGLSDYFRRPEQPEEGGTVLVAPGRYPVAYWSTKTYSHHYGAWEYDNGLALVDQP